MIPIQRILMFFGFVFLHITFRNAIAVPWCLLHQMHQMHRCMNLYITNIQLCNNATICKIAFAFNKPMQTNKLQIEMAKSEEN